jgi:hypothetical protein
MKPLKPLAPGRIRCCIPFCGRTFKKVHEGEYETMCGRHWRLGDKKLRDLRSRLMRVYKRGIQGPERERIEILLDRLWDRVKAQATERAMGA